MTQVVELLLCKHKALSSNPSPTKKNKNIMTGACDRGSQEAKKEEGPGLNISFKNMHPMTSFH
jgi:hypothetical protein